jgi:hypothetical protein
MEQRGTRQLNHQKRSFLAIHKIQNYFQKPGGKWSILQRKMLPDNFWAEHML